tara:strand:+ start:21544 stop:21954 length:411 start_codon:yes stop_codon:yes gene_type:complete
MGTIGVIPKIILLIKGIGIIGYTLSQPKLKVSFKKIEIVMGVKSKILPQSTVVHILINERKTGIGVIVQLLPFLVTICFPIISQDKSTRVIGNQMGNIRIVQQYGTVVLANIQGIPFGFLRVLGKAKSCRQTAQKK